MAVVESHAFTQPLLRAIAFPHPAAEIRYLEAHISWLLLTGSDAYRIRGRLRLNRRRASDLNGKTRTAGGHRSRTRNFLTR